MVFYNTIVKQRYMRKVTSIDLPVLFMIIAYTTDSPASFLSTANKHLVY